MTLHRPQEPKPDPIIALVIIIIVLLGMVAWENFKHG